MRFIGGYRGEPNIEEDVDILEQLGYDYYAYEVDAFEEEIPLYPFEEDDKAVERLIEQFGD